MSYIFIKQWKPKASWLAMSLEERKAFVERAQKFLGPLANEGLETIAWLEVSADEKINSADYPYFSVYRAKSRGVMDHFHQAMMNFNWYEHFEQKNAMGPIEGPGTILTRIMTLKKE